MSLLIKTLLLALTLNMTESNVFEDPIVDPICMEECNDEPECYDECCERQQITNQRSDEINDKPINLHQFSLDPEGVGPDGSVYFRRSSHDNPAQFDSENVKSVDFGKEATFDFNPSPRSPFKLGTLPSIEPSGHINLKAIEQFDFEHHIGGTENYGCSNPKYLDINFLPDKQKTIPLNKKKDDNFRITGVVPNVIRISHWMTGIPGLDSMFF